MRLTALQSSQFYRTLWSGLKPQATLGHASDGKAFPDRKSFSSFLSEAPQGSLSASDTESGSVFTCVAEACVFTL